MNLSHFFAWVEVLWHHAFHNTLPPVPTGTVAVSVPPIDGTKNTPGMNVTAAPPPGTPNTSNNPDGTPKPIPTSDSQPPGTQAAQNAVVHPNTPNVKPLPEGCSWFDQERGLITIPALVGLYPDYDSWVVNEIAGCCLPGSKAQALVNYNTLLLEASIENFGSPWLARTQDVHANDLTGGWQLTPGDAGMIKGAHNTPSRLGTVKEAISYYSDQENIPHQIGAAVAAAKK